MKTFRIKNITIKNRSTLIILLSSLNLLFYSCDRDKKHPGYTYFPDMAYSRAYETYDENPVFEDNKTMHSPIEGTVPRGFVPYNLTKSIEDRQKAGEKLLNPFVATNEHIMEGKRLYGIFCVQCHGKKGDGKGFLFTSGRYPYPPASLIADKVQEGPTAEIYHVTTVGYGIMGAHGAQISPADRWEISTYVKHALAQKQPDSIK